MYTRKIDKKKSYKNKFQYSLHLTFFFQACEISLLALWSLVIYLFK
jgi:hypothetical protein